MARGNGKTRKASLRGANLAHANSWRKGQEVHAIEAELRALGLTDADIRAAIKARKAGAKGKRAPESPHDEKGRD